MTTLRAALPLDALPLDAGALGPEAFDAAAAGRPVLVVDQLTTGQEAIR